MDEEAWVENVSRSEKDIAFTVETRDGEYRGNIGLHEINHREQNAEPGVVLGNKKHWGKGYSTEAVKLILEYGFSELNLHRIYPWVLATNPRAVRCYEKCGFAEEGCLRQHVDRRGKFVDVIVMGIFKEGVRRQEARSPEKQVPVSFE